MTTDDADTAAAEPALGSLVPESHRDLLEAPLVGVLGTVTPNGQPHLTAVWYLLDRGVLAMSTLASRRKFRNLRQNPRATLFVMDPANPMRTLEVRGEAELVPDPDRTMVPRFAAHYGVDPARLDLPGERWTIRLHARRVVAFP